MGLCFMCVCVCVCACDVYYYICQRLKLKGETERNDGFYSKEPRSDTDEVGEVKDGECDGEYGRL